MITHWYTQRTHTDNKFKPLCFKNPKDYLTQTDTVKFTTSSIRVSCQKCLDILIARKESELEFMRNNRKVAESLEDETPLTGCGLTSF
jgi:hypothetical protein